MKELENLFKKLDKPNWFNYNDCSYLTTMGSHVFGTSNNDSDYDFYGFIFAPIELTFPHTQGEILGFGRNIQRFEQVQYDHLPFKNTTTDITIYNIVKYFHLVMMGNPNMVDSLFVPEECIVFQDRVASMVRNNRRIFLSQKSLHTFKGMMMAHLSRLKSNHTKEGRLDLERKYGYDVKDGYHSLRMMLELEQILYTGDLDLRSHSNILNQVRNGEIEKDWLINECEMKLWLFERNQDKFVVPHSPDEDKIKRLLVNCLEEHFGNLSKYSYNIL